MISISIHLASAANAPLYDEMMHTGISICRALANRSHETCNPVELQDHRTGLRGAMHSTAADQDSAAAPCRVAVAAAVDVAFSRQPAAESLNFFLWPGWLATWRAAACVVLTVLVVVAV
ncbi:hypothetical protein E2562_018389 [Oryza meyeriana var. granulata]|uniref:Uncharacterized protein n=1 Tax=Oryza meyeriana var. granulata TaxID=110450 RepID=A0A6G1D5J2_9ORYZ|nr:hypothetical protein E2562_018389 [Oryza meyeriana var. granulata]